ncbi:MAG TPA: hypothetical protein DCL41_00260 [Bdellovibrionales bacterium]|nr:hypothetical protein [Pseudobdellovibrionaceae bacterium]HAG90270.1 hypothetical protein [Bdellovibrionales bacterium]|tara:strand:- start:1758 stop:2336 length:579 start_codon:yes stop_codon:yes gene_type:complete
MKRWLLLLLFVSFSVRAFELGLDARLSVQGGYGNAKFDTADNEAPATSMGGGRVQIGLQYDKKYSAGFGASYTDFQQRDDYKAWVGNRSGTRTNLLEFWVSGEAAEKIFVTGSAHILSEYTFKKKSEGEDIVLDGPLSMSGAVSYQVTPTVYISAFIDRSTYSRKKSGGGSTGKLANKLNLTHYGLELGLRY